MGPANKNITAHINKCSFNAVNGSSQKTRQSPAAAHIYTLTEVHCQHKKRLFSSHDSVFQFGFFRETGILPTVMLITLAQARANTLRNNHRVHIAIRRQTHE